MNALPSSAPCPTTFLRQVAWVALAAACLVGFGAAPVAPVAHAQSAAQETRAAVYRYARPGQETMQVGVWGAVEQPGLYEVPVETDLMELLSISGGPQVSQQFPDQTQTIFLRLARGPGGAISEGGSTARREIIFEAQLEEVSEQSRDIPALTGGDVLTIEKQVRERFNWRDTLSVLQASGTLALIVLDLIRQ